jgi:hypothetical protein
VREVSQRLDDRFNHRTYDEVTSFDAPGGRSRSWLDLTGPSR